MKPIVVTLRLDCRDDVPVDVLDWMANRLAEYAKSAFGADYDPELTGYYASPLLYSHLTAIAAIDTRALDNERIWRDAGAPPSSVTLPPIDPVTAIIRALWECVPQGEPRHAVINQLTDEQRRVLTAEMPNGSALIATEWTGSAIVQPTMTRSTSR